MGCGVGVKVVLADPLQELIGGLFRGWHGRVLRENFPAGVLPHLERRQELDQVGRVEELGRSDGAEGRPRDGRDREPAALHQRLSALATFEERTEVVEVAVWRYEKVSTRVRT